MYDIGADPERQARLAAELKLSQLSDKYNRLLIQTVLADAVRNAGAEPLLVVPHLTPKAQVATGSSGHDKVVIVTDAGTIAPAQAVAEMKTSEEFAYLFAPLASDVQKPSPETLFGRSRH